MGKYTHVLKGLPKLDNADEPTRQESLDKEQALIAAEGVVNPPRLAALYRDARLRKDKLEAELSVVNIRIDALSQMIQTSYDAEGIAKIQLADGSSVAAQLEPYAQVKDKETYWQWCRDNGLERSMTLPWATTNSQVKERLLKGMPMPPGVEAFIKTKLVLRKAGTEDDE